MISVELHGFSDASEKAYAAAIYSRVVSREGEVLVSLLLSKTRVAPLKRVSIPRLEFCAVALLAELGAHLLSIKDFQGFPITCWTDSTIVLAWLERPSNAWKTFVANRVSLIQTSLPSAS